MTFIKQLLRSPVRAAAFMLLLALSGAMLYIGFNAYIDVNKQVAALNENYTTIAIPDYRVPESSIAEISPKAAWGDREWLKYASLENDRKILIESAKEAAATSKKVEQIDSRGIFSAYTEGGVPLTSGSLEWWNYKYEFDRPYDLSVLAITCNDIEKSETELGSFLYDPDGTSVEDKFTVVQYEVTAELDECTLMHEDYAPPEKLILRGNIMDSNGNIPFERGKRYLVWGTFQAQTIEQTGPDKYDINEESTAVLDLGKHPIYEDSAEIYDEEYIKDGVLYRVRKMIETYPICAELPEGMDAAGFLSSEEGRVWREGIMQAGARTLQSVPVISTDKLESMLLFNNREAYITQGRAFDKNEYKNGEKVCIINADYAKKNGLQVGDSLELSFYNTGYERQEYVFGSNDPNNYTTLIAGRPYIPGAELSEAEEYTVVGIYRSPGFTFSSYSFSPNTVFIPAASVKPPIAPEGYETDNMDVLYSIVLKNGTAEAFEAELEAQGYGGCFLYYDQGYAEASEGIDAMVLNAGRLMLFSTVLFLTAGVLFAYLYMRWARRSAGIMRLIGARPGQVFTGMSVCALLAAGVSLAVGCIISYFLYDGICEAVFGAGGGEMSFSVPWALIGAAAGLAFITAACMCFFAKTALGNPIRTKEK